MTKDKEQDKPLRWGFSTGACMCALALGAWRELENAAQPHTAQPHVLQEPVALEFLDGRMRRIPLLDKRVQGCLAVQKDGGDDPDCTHKAIFFGNIRAASMADAKAEDYILQVGEATLIVHALEGIGLCRRVGLDCEQGKWAITTGPREMLRNNVRLAGMHTGVWLFSLGVVNGAALAKHSLNAHLGIEGGISILGTTGLVRPFSHDAYKATIKLCVRSHHVAGGASMVFCTGGRTKKGAQKYLSHLPPTAFACIADFIAVSVQSACAHDMQEIIIACMPGKLCKYAAGYENTHAHKAQQDMRILRAAVQKNLPHALRLHKALEKSVSVREALLSLSDSDCKDVLHELAAQALVQLQGFATAPVKLRILLFDFQGNFILEKSSAKAAGESSFCLATNFKQSQVSMQDKAATAQEAQDVMRITEAPIDEDYFLVKDTPICKN